ncbi:hypothetical protein SDRG_12287 [Saprolegnia diclina VS20]|uniref:Erythroid differentiation-related factor 1 n=1 Tax=Saprolegnia diclina (strain VS20) TaxID=1156394 RepID=T0RJI5_SAPDV|nr:hypothetical protein SDRG_12287 [Saprolegnia diclina VS20]EQC30007.1 hypothetical protein SDRG_12287 [Saprolegnia diclina VS20]|eukprot:XP_008616574.1 hypothetical protein SDRG_12287 [Saprolegnia diclina VS20]
MDDDAGVVEFTSDAQLIEGSDAVMASTAETGLVLVPSPAVRFKQLEKNTDLNLSPTAKERRVHQAYLQQLQVPLRTPRQPQMSLRLHHGRVELAGCGYEYGLPETTPYRSMPGASAPSTASDDLPSSGRTSPKDMPDVHFLGPAESIKTLFKLPYSRSRVSLAIHRVGNTLVVDGDVDETDLPKGFDECNEVLRIGHSTPLLEQDPALFENFIYQSTLALPPPEADDDEFAPAVSLEPKAKPSKAKLSAKEKKRRAKRKKQAQQQQHPSLSPLHRPPWDDDATEEDDTTSSYASSSSPLPNVVPAFQRILKWKFHDMQMLLGSDVQLFSNKEHPSVSLKLHDADQDLSLCTVLDYYLDNVIANIPELAICMHSKGHVRGYQLVETRDIPYLNGSSTPLFDVHDVNLNATMLFKFLQNNCSEANGTYWLYRAEGDFSLRLYDVRMLARGQQRKWKYMMAMLCYRFASRAARLISSAFEAPALQTRLRHRQRELLGTCLELLKELRRDHGGSRAQDSISASVAEQMADTYLRELDESSSESEKAAHLRSAKLHLQTSIRVLEGCVADYFAEKDAKHHATASTGGLPLSETVLSSPTLRGGGHESGREEDDDDDEDDAVGLFMEEEVSRLQLKHASTALHLAAVYMENHAIADALRSLHDACGFLRFDALPPPTPLAPVDSIAFFHSFLDDLDFGGVGHAKSKTFLKPLYSETEVRANVLEALGDLASSQRLGDLAPAVALTYQLLTSAVRPSTMTSLQQAFAPAAFGDLVAAHRSLLDATTNVSFLAYLRALSPPVNAEHYFVLMKKLGNAANETAKSFLAQKDLQQAYLWFEGGSLLFEAIEDGANAALLCANLANLHKILADADGRQEEHYAKAVGLCTKAHALLKSSRASEVHAKVTGELALTYLVWAVRLSLNAPVHSDAETKIAAKFNKALHLYLEINDARQVASTHYQMASFYSRQLVGKLEATTRTKMELARRHYEKALLYFGVVDVGKTFVIIHQELAALYAASDKAEDIEHALLVLLNTYEAYSKSHRLSLDDRTTLATVAPSILEGVQTYLLRLVRAPCATKSVKQRSSVFKQMYKEAICHRDAPLAQVLLTLRSLYAS